jgi:NADH oxidase (H2O-forming)
MADRADLVDPTATGESAPSAPPPVRSAPRSVAIVYGSRYGNTKRIAEALARGLREVDGVVVEVGEIERFPLGTIRSSDLIAVGGPTEWRTASGPVKRFLAALAETDVHGKRAFAFDTRYRGPFSGSAASTIEGRLEDLGLVPIRPPESASVGPTPDVGQDNLLAVGEEDRFERIGREIGEALTARA